MRIFVVLFLLVGISFADTIYVSGLGDPCAMGSIHTTIQGAINVAVDGDVVVVCSDATYIENVVVNKSVDIRSDESGKLATVRAAAVSSPVLSLNADQVNLSNLLLRDATGSYGLYSTASYSNIHNVTAINNDIGFYLLGSSFNNLTSNIAHDNVNEGFRLFGGSDNNTLIDNIAYNQLYYGFYLDASSNNRLISNTAYNSSSWYGFFLYSDATDNELMNNTAFYNGHHGFHVYLNSKNYLSDNIAYNNSAEGFMVSSSSSNRLDGNIAYNNSAEGFMLSSSSNNLLEGNTAHGNLQSGFIISSGSGNNLSNNIAYNNSLYGFHLHLSSQNRLLTNDAYSQGEGFHLFGGSDNHLSSNTAHDNGIGFYLDSSSSNDLSNNTAFSNEIHGFLFSSGSENNISDNVAYGNLQYGFYGYLGSNDLQGNTAYDNLDGFLVSSSTGNRILDNTAYDNLENGIYLYLSSHNLVANNTVYGNSLHGFYLYESPQNELISNTARDNLQNGLYVYLSPQNNVTNNTPYDNLGHGFAISSSSHTTLTDNLAFGNSLDGFNVLLSPDARLIGNTAHDNSETGSHLQDSGNVILEAEHYYSNSVEFRLNASESSMGFTASGMIVDNPSGSLENYTNISIADSLLPDSGYMFRWASQPDALPHPHISFKNKFVEITALQGSPSIDAISWHWLDSEVSPEYRESEFNIWQHDGTDWAYLEANLNTSENTLSLSGLVPESTYALLQNRTPPNLLLHDPGPGAVVNTTETNLSFTVYSFDPTVLCVVELNSNTTNMTANSGERFDLPVVLPEDSYLWNVTCTDSIGTNSSETRSFLVDFPPSVLLDSPDSEYINTTDYELSFSTTDNISSTMNCSLYIDAVFNQSMSAANSEPNSFLIVDLEEGSHTLQVLCQDEVGNTAASEVKEITSDLTAPRVSLLSPPDGYYGNDSMLAFSINATDDLSPTLNYSLFIDEVLVDSGTDPIIHLPVSEGNHNWSVSVTDAAGNKNDSETRHFNIDRTPPSLEVLEPGEELVLITSDPHNLGFVFNATDDIASVLSCSLYLDNITNQTNASIVNGELSSFNVSDLQQGLHIVYISCSDGAGNSAASADYSVFVDFRPPSLELLSPEDGYFGSDSTITFDFNATDEISDQVNSSLYIDGGLYQTTTSNSFTVALPEGTHAWRIQAVDEAGNSNLSEERHLTLDQTAPVITVHTPSSREVILSTNPVDVTFNFTATDDYAPGIDCSVYMDADVEYSNTSVQNGSSVSFLRTLDRGSYRWWVECSDDVANTRSTDLRTITIRSTSSDDEDDEEEEDPDPSISISLSKNCPNDSITFTVSSGSDTWMRLIDSDGFLLNFTRTDDDGQATFPIAEEGRYEIRASKSSYRADSRDFNYAMCIIPPPTDGGDDAPDPIDPPANESVIQEPAEEEVVPEETNETMPQEPEIPSDVEVEIDVNDTAFQDEEVFVLVFVNDEAAPHVRLRVTSPENEVQTLFTDAFGEAIFIPDKLGRYRISVLHNDLPTETVFVDVILKDVVGSSLSKLGAVPLTVCIPIFLPFLLLMLVLMIVTGGYVSQNDGRKSGRRYQGFKRKR
jgi:parallel beta-helix repeat protein